MSHYVPGTLLKPTSYEIVLVNESAIIGHHWVTKNSLLLVIALMEDLQNVGEYHIDRNFVQTHTWFMMMDCTNGNVGMHACESIEHEKRFEIIS